MEMSLVRNQTSLQNFGYWIKYTTERRLRTLFVLKCLDFYLGICLQDVGKGSLLQDVCLKTWFLCLYLWNILPLLTYFIMQVAFLSSNLAIGRKGCLWVFFVMKPWLVIHCLFTTILLSCLNDSCASFFGSILFSMPRCCAHCMTVSDHVTGTLCRTVGSKSCTGEQQINHGIASGE